MAPVAGASRGSQEEASDVGRSFSKEVARLSLGMMMMTSSVGALTGKSDERKASQGS